MPRFKFNKLVRDKIVDSQIAAGSTPTFHQLRPAEHKRALVDKIIEEAKEITQADPGEIAAEIADVQQALDDLKELYGLSNEEIAEAQNVKAKKNGAFKKGLFIDYVDVDESDQWVPYYRKNADRYPEIM